MAAANAVFPLGLTIATTDGSGHDLILCVVSRASCRCQTRLQFARMKIAIGADHAGYQLKDSLKRLLDELGVAYEDFGTLVGAVGGLPGLRAGGRRGRRQAASSIAASWCAAPASAWRSPPTRCAGVRSAAIVDTDTAKLSREHNDLNVLTLGARVTPGSRAPARSSRSSSKRRLPAAVTPRAWRKSKRSNPAASCHRAGPAHW